MLQLHHDRLTFSAFEQGSGQVALCLHGFPDCARSFRAQLPALAAAGYRAIAPTLRGYEPGSQPAEGDYHPLRCAEDVVAWLDELGARQCHLIGHDWGAVIGYLAAALAPARFYSLTTLAIPHPGRLGRKALQRRPNQLRNSWYMAFFQLQGLSERALAFADFALLEKLWRDWSPGFTPPAAELRAVKQTFRQPGVVHAALSYYRAQFNLGSEASRAARQLLRAPIRVPTLALSGALDGCMDTRLHDDLMHARDFPAGLRVERLQGAGHFLHQEQPERVNPLLLSWLAEHGPRA